MFKILMAIALIMAPLSNAFAEVKLAYIELQKAIQATDAGKEAKKTLEGIFEKRKKELTAMENDLKKMGEDLEQKKSIVAADVLAKRQQEMQQEMIKYRELVGKSQLEMQQRERDLTGPILEKMEKVLQKVADAGGYTMVLERGQNGVVWAKKDLDITDQVIKAFNESKEKLSGKGKSDSK